MLFWVKSQSHESRNCAPKHRACSRGLSSLDFSRHRFAGPVITLTDSSQMSNLRAGDRPRFTQFQWRLPEGLVDSTLRSERASPEFAFTDLTPSG
jgi:hypothetical protein